MSICTPEIAAEQISVANEASPRAIFRCRLPGMVDSIFASTCMGLARLQADAMDTAGILVGVYWKGKDGMTVSQMREEIADVVARFGPLE